MLKQTLIRRARQILIAPMFTNETQTRRARLLNIILLFTIAATVLNALSVGLLTPGQAHSLWINAAVLAVQCGVLVMLRQGRVRAAGLTLVLALWLGITVAVHEDGGISSPNFASYTVVVIMAAVLLGRRTALGFALISSGVGVYYLLATTSNGSGALLANFWVLGVAAFLLYIFDLSYEEALRRLLRNEMALAETNRDLQQEILERMATETALRESEERYRQLLEKSPAGMLVLSIEGRILYGNRAAAGLLGAEAAPALIGLRPQDFLLPAPDQITQGRLTPSAETVAAPPAEYLVRRLDGSLVNVELVSIPIYYEKQSSILCVVGDITERKHAQEELLKAERLRVELDNEKARAKLKETFISMMSHEFRTPLTVVQSSKELLDLYFDRLSPERRKEHLDKIGVQINYMVDMLNDILTLSKASAGMLEFRPEPRNLEAFCKSLFEEFRLTTKTAHIQFRFSSSRQWDGFPLDEKLLRHVLLNLLNNAVKYSPQGGEIHLELGAERDHAVIAVSDQGMGIPPEDLPNLFEPFHRGRNAGTIEGTGLGLAIAKNHIEAHGGTIDCLSQIGLGSTFTIRLPWPSAARAQAS